MRGFLNLVLADFRQRTRSYSFLILMFITIYIASTFVPPLDASYQTISLKGFRGLNNAAWVGAVTAVMSSTFLLFFGFYLINSSIYRDIKSKVGLVVSASPLSNRKYLFSKFASNLLLMFTLSAVVQLMGVFIFLFRNEGFPMVASDFLLPWIFIGIPAIIFLSSVAVIFEIIFVRRTSLQNFAYFVLVVSLLAGVAFSDTSFFSVLRDVAGGSALQASASQDLHAQTGVISDTFFSIGYQINLAEDAESLKTFTLSSIQWSGHFLLTRLTLVVFSLVSVFLTSVFFHRFDLAPAVSKKTTQSASTLQSTSASFRTGELPKIQTSFSLLPVMISEWKIMIRGRSKWLTALTIGGMIALVFAPIEVAHPIILPLLWFIQVARFSDVFSRDVSLRIQYFSFSSFKPLQRLLSSQILAVTGMLVLIALPLILRYLAIGELFTAGGIVLGALFLVLLSAAMGLLTGGKKLFELFFCILTYMNLNQVPFLDFFAAFSHGTTYWIVFFSSILSLLTLVYYWKHQQLSRY